MTLLEYLKKFHRIAWYPSCGKDGGPLAALSKKRLQDYGIPGMGVIDCFIYTDYMSFAEQEDNHRFFLDWEHWQYRGNLQIDEGYEAQICNVRELSKLELGFDRDMVAFDKDPHYGRAFACDMMVKHPDSTNTVTRLVYVIAENTAFAHEFLLKNHIKVEYLIHSNYGHGFGCGRSNGAALTHLFKDLGVKYFASDMEDMHYDEDVATKYLSEEQKSIIPVLRQIGGDRILEPLYGYGPTLLYEVIGYEAAPNDKTVHYILEK